MLTGLLTGLALAPVAGTVRRVVDTENDYADEAALSRTADFIARDVSMCMRLAPNTVMIKDHEALGSKADDCLMVLTVSPAKQGMTAGAVVYKVAEGGILHGDTIAGLYRWIIPGVELSTIDPDKLKPEDAQLVLPGVEEFSAEIPSGNRRDDYRKEYSGRLPAGIFLSIRRGEGESGKYEGIFAFP